MDFPLLDPVWWNWYLAGVLLICLELVVPGSLIVWFGLGALVAGLVTHLTGGIYWPYQFLIFAVFSLVSLLVGRRFIKQATPSKSTTLNRRLQMYLGRQGTLESAIENGKGRIKLDGTYWYVHGPSLPAGTQVEVVGIENSTLVVAKVESGS